MKDSTGRLPPDFIAAIEDAADMLRAEHLDAKCSSSMTAADPLPSLLDQCRDLVAENAKEAPEPIRTIHHFACTGGTLISKCIASLPNTHLLSEVDPLSKLGPASRGAFLPTDLIGLTRWGSREVDEELLIEIFISGLATLYDDRLKKGVRLVLRDHAHSQFCFGEKLPLRLTLLDMLKRRFHALAIVTVRHPVDSYLSLHANGWLHFVPQSIEEYVYRYNAFLDRYQSAELFRYEDFVQNPDQCIKQMADALDLPYSEQCTSVFDLYTLSGDSGRKGQAIFSRSRRAIPSNLYDEIARSHSLPALCDRLGYDLNVTTAS